MAVEQLKYDFDLNLAKAEKQLDQFFNKMEQRLDRTSDTMEKKVAKASQPKAATSARTANKEKNELERKLREEDRIIERYEQQRAKRRERLNSIMGASTERGKSTFDRAKSFMGDETLYHKAEADYAQFRKRQVEITEQASFKSLAVVQAELAREEALYRQSVASLKGQHTANKNAGLASARQKGKMTSMAFNTQQMIEDYNYAGFRGLSNNLAFLGATLGGSAGLAIVAGVAAKGLYDLAKSMLGVGDAAAEAEARNRRYLNTVKEMAKLKQLGIDAESDFDVPRTMKDFDKRQANLEKQRKALADPRRESVTQDEELVKLKRLADIGREMKKAFSVTSGGGIGFGTATKLNALKAQYESIRKTMLRPDSVPGVKQGVAVDLTVIEARVKELQEELDTVLEIGRGDKARLEADQQLLDKNKQITVELEKHDKLNDSIKSKLQEQISAEEQLVEASKKRMESIADSRYGFKDSVSDKILDHQTKQVEKHFDKRIDHMVDFDKRRNEIMFKRMGGDQVPGLRNRFEQWQEHRTNALKSQGERASYNAQARLSQIRALELLTRAESEASKAREFSAAGNMPQADRMFDRSIGSYQKIMELQERFMNMEGNPGRQEAFFAEYQKFAKIIDGLMEEQSKAHENFGKAHAETLTNLKQMEVRLTEINALADRFQFIDDGDLTRIKEFNAELEKMAGDIKKAAEAQPDRKGEMPAGGGGLFSIPSGPIDGLAGGEGAKAPLLSRAERGAKRIAEINESVQKKFASREKERQQVEQKRNQAREEAHQKRLATIKRLEERKGGGLAGGAPKAPMEGAWGAIDPKARAQGYWPMIRQQLDLKENDLRQVGGERGMRNAAIRQRRLQALRREAYDAKNELDAGTTGRRAGQLAEQMQGILKDITGIDPDRPIKQAAEKITPKWSKRARDGSWTHGEGVLAPSTFSPAGVNTTSPLGFKGPVPGGVGVQNNNNSVNMTNHTVINNVQNMDATKFQRDLASKAKAAKARQGL